MKRFIFLFVALLCCVSATAQVVFVATLQHEGTTTQYYGQGALNSAYNAAVDGDTITLSEGTFNVPQKTDMTSDKKYLTKNITIRGIGFNNEKKSSISGYFYVMPKDEDKKVLFEDIHFIDNFCIFNTNTESINGKIHFKNCLFNYISVSSINEDYKDYQCQPKAYFYNCIINKISRTMLTDLEKSEAIINFINCYIKNPDFNSYNYEYEEYQNFLFNCIINYTNCDLAVYTNNTYFKNCIFIWNVSWAGDPSYYYFLDKNNIAVENCLTIGNAFLFTHLTINKNNLTTKAASEVFKTYRNDYIDGETFELTNNAKTKYIGSDGTEMGMLGGFLPYNPNNKPIPIITKFNADKYTTKDGKLTIEVNIN